MKIFNIKTQILVGAFSSAEAKSRYFNALQGHNEIFGFLPDRFWAQDYVEQAARERYPRVWREWIDRKSGQLRQLGELALRPFNRCGTERA